jgi:predicted N-acetyltransferase YhbS
MCVHPEFQGLGVGSSLMAWGNEEADRRGLEGFIEGAQEGLYARAGYKPGKAMSG